MRDQAKTSNKKRKENTSSKQAGFRKQEHQHHLTKLMNLKATSPPLLRQGTHMCCIPHLAALQAPSIRLVALRKIKTYVFIIKSGPALDRGVDVEVQKIMLWRMRSRQATLTNLRGGHTTCVTLPCIRPSGT